MRHVISFVAALALASSVSAQAEQSAATPSELVPSGPWQASYEEGLCRLSRVFRSGSDQYALSFEQLVPSTTVDIAVAGPALAEFQAQRTAAIKLANGLQDIRIALQLGSIEGFGDAILIQGLNLSAGQAAPDAASTPVPFGKGLDLEVAQQLEFLAIAQGDKSVVLKTGNLRDPFQVLNDCTSHALNVLGFDPDELLTARQGPKLADPRQLSQTLLANYPPRALMNNEQGSVGVLVKINEKGAVFDCVVIADSGSSALNKAACNGMRSATFEPALDADGQAIASYHATRVTYRLP